MSQKRDYKKKIVNTTHKISQMHYTIVVEENTE